MKLLIQIPCFNEEDTLPLVLADIPSNIDGIDSIETLVVDDGSSDGTVRVAQELGVDHIVQHNVNRGLARSFRTGMDACLSVGADIIVNTDGDNQYPGSLITDLIAPILDGNADIVIGDRQTDQIEEFTPSKRILQSLGSRVVRAASSTQVPDAPSGFRAFSRDAALQLNIFTDYTYTLETIIQAGKKGLTVISIPIKVNPVARDSRLIRSNWGYIKRSASTILRLYAFYEPLKTFFYLSLPFLFVGAGLLLRFAWLYLTGESGIGRHLQSMFVGGIASVIGVLILILGILADLSVTNRRLTEEIMYRLRKRDLE
ncbi:MAG: glycosyltransferase family 2 protein [Chloroflexota bacterium]